MLSKIENNSLIKSLYKFFIVKNKFDLGQKFFLMGIFFLPSAFVFGALLLLGSLITSFTYSKKNIFKSKGNILILISIGIILLSTIKNSLYNIPNELITYEKNIIWTNLFNWLPVLYGFWGFQIYLKTYDQRIKFARFLIMGTIPVIFSCFLQYFFKIYGPFYFLNGLIVWFQKPIELTGGVAGLFSNTNYLALWLSATLPFILYFLRTYKNNLNKYTLITLSIFTIVFLIFTNSRNGSLSLIIIITSYYGLKRFIVCLSFISTFFIVLNSLNLLRIINLSYFNLFDKISDFTFAFEGSPRFIIYQAAISFIRQKPFLGWGASTFPYLNSNHNIVHRVPYIFLDAQHTHNMLFELAHNFGIPLAIIIFSSLIILFIKTYKKLKKQKKDNLYFFNKCWYLACFIVLLMNLTDVTFYDGRISLIICILFAGLRCIQINSSKLTI